MNDIVLIIRAILIAGCLIYTIGVIIFGIAEKEETFYE